MKKVSAHPLIAQRKSTRSRMAPRARQLTFRNTKAMSAAEMTHRTTNWMRALVRN